MTTRKAARATLTAILTAAMSTCQQVHGYYKSSTDAKSPVLCLHSTASERPTLSFQGNRAIYGLDVIVFVKRSGLGITEEAAENELDDVAQQLSAVIASNDANIAWLSLTAGRSSVIAIEDTGGNPYWMEVTPLVIECASGT